MKSAQRFTSTIDNTQIILNQINHCHVLCYILTWHSFADISHEFVSQKHVHRQYAFSVFQRYQAPNLAMYILSLPLICRSVVARNIHWREHELVRVASRQMLFDKMHNTICNHSLPDDLQLLLSIDVRFLSANHIQICFGWCWMCLLCALCWLTTLYVSHAQSSYTHILIAATQLVGYKYIYLYLLEQISISINCWDLSPTCFDAVCSFCALHKCVWCGASYLSNIYCLKTIWLYAWRHRAEPPNSTAYPAWRRHCRTRDVVRYAYALYENMYIYFLRCDLWSLNVVDRCGLYFGVTTVKV